MRFILFHYTYYLFLFVGLSPEKKNSSTLVMINEHHFYAIIVLALFLDDT